jgi:ABC-type phosphate transport system substrate-binding protein
MTFRNVSQLPGGRHRREVSARRLTAIAVAVIAALLLAGIFEAPPAAAQAKTLQIAIVTHPQTPVDNLTLAEMRRVFRGERQYWTPNVPIVLLIRAPVAQEREVILKRVYAMSEAQFKQFWIAKIFRDEAAIVPKNLYSTEQISELVSTIPGSISFVDAAAVRPGLKVVKIDGLLPGQPGYPLQ